MSAMRAFNIASVSAATVIVPSSTSARNRLIMSRPRCCCGASAPNRPSDTIWSRRLSSLVSAAAAAAWTSASVLAIGGALLDLGLHLLELGFTGERLLEDLLQLLIALEAPA